jgi:hypothetical protein
MPCYYDDSDDRERDKKELDKLIRVTCEVLTCMQFYKEMGALSDETLEWLEKHKEFDTKHKENNE